MTDAPRIDRPLRLLVAIASYGQKNQEFLRTIIQRYRSMSFAVEVVVFSESPKELGDRIEVIVGLPAKNPWTLPFAHKTLFAQRVENYDLFIYSEDDMEVTEENIQAFLRLTAVLGSDEIAGYLRYEINDDKTRILTDVHGAFHWKSASIRQRGPYTVAEFTNEHAGFYILTQSQLRRAIASGGYLRAPYDGRYGLPETAATDPYTSCGFRKVVGISALEDFLIRHMSNLYVARHGLSLSSFKDQIQTLMDICNGTHPASTLCEVESKFLQNAWSKSYYEKPCDELLAMVPDDAETILSVGCGWGATEVELQQRGTAVTALPLDSVIGATVARRGIDVIYGTLEECLTKVRSRKFHCLLMTNLLHLLPDPWRILEECARLVREDGTLVISGPNLNSIPVLARRALGWGDYRKLGNFAKSGIHVHSLALVKRQIKKTGLRISASRWINHEYPRHRIKAPQLLRRFVARDWIVQATRCDSPSLPVDRPRTLPSPPVGEKGSA